MSAPTAIARPVRHVMYDVALKGALPFLAKGFLILELLSGAYLRVSCRY